MTKQTISATEKEAIHKACKEFLSEKLDGSKGGCGWNSEKEAVEGLSRITAIIAIKGDYPLVVTMLVDAYQKVCEHAGVSLTDDVLEKALQVANDHWPVFFQDIAEKSKDAAWEGKSVEEALAQGLGFAHLRLVRKTCARLREEIGFENPGPTRIEFPEDLLDLLAEAIGEKEAAVFESVLERDRILGQAQAMASYAVEHVRKVIEQNKEKLIKPVH